MKNKRNRQWLMGGILSILIILLWWVYLYSPAQAKIADIKDQQSIYIDKRKKVVKKIDELNKTHSDNMIQDNEMNDFANLIINGKNLEEVNSAIQIKIQNFIEKNDILLNKYQVLKSGKWKGYSIGKLQFSLRTYHKGLSDLLKFIEDMKKLVRIERMNLNYRKSKNFKLNVDLRLETLFVDASNKG